MTLADTNCQPRQAVLASRPAFLLQFCPSMRNGANDIPETLSRLQPALDAFTTAIEGGRPDAVQAAKDRLTIAVTEASSSAWPDGAPGPRGLRLIRSATVTSRT